MRQFYKERFKAQKQLAKKISTTLEANAILEKMRAEARALIPHAMEVCILLLDSEAPNYTKPLQCQLYETPVNCLSCKRFRPAVVDAMVKKKGIITPLGEPVERPDGEIVDIGPEMAFPIFSGDEVLAVISVVSKPDTKFSKKDLLLMEDLAETAGNVIINAKQHWKLTQEKLQISGTLSTLFKFVPQSVRHLVGKDPEGINMAKEKKEVTVLFLDLENYTRLSSSLPFTEVHAMVEKLFSRFVDPIQRFHGDINETSGDGLMIIFKDHDPKVNANNAVMASLDIHEQTRLAREGLGEEFSTINVNMGINSGEALVGMTQFSGALDTRMTYTASGPVTNLAARLGGQAKGGDILIGENTKHLIQGIISVHERGLIKLKGIKEPVKVYSLLENP
jgi:class 3 adenylate cyclase